LKVFRSGRRRSIDNLTLVGRLYTLYYGSLQRRIYKRAFRSKIEVIVAVSGYFTEVLAREKFRVKVEHIYNGVVLPEPSAIVNLNRLLYVGRLEDVKGVDILLRAMTRIVEDAPFVRLDIVGDGTCREELEAFAREHGLHEYVRFHGWLDGDPLYQQYRESTIVIIPSIGPEAAPLVCIEALAIGRPVIGTNTGGLPELIRHNKTGVIVRPGEPDDIARAVTDLLSRKDLSEIAQTCTESAQRYSMSTFLDNVERLYREVIASA
jgi:glycosyltransferase involved in cell wall biosynthesis